MSPTQRRTEGASLGDCHRHLRNRSGAWSGRCGPSPEGKLDLNRTSEAAGNGKGETAASNGSLPVTIGVKSIEPLSFKPLDPPRKAHQSRRLWVRLGECFLAGQQDGDPGDRRGVLRRRPKEPRRSSSLVAQDDGTISNNICDRVPPGGLNAMAGRLPSENHSIDGGFWISLRPTWRMSEVCRISPSVRDPG